VLPFQYEPSVPNQLDRHLEAAHQRGYSETEDPGRDTHASDHRARDTRAFPVCTDSTRAVGAMTKRGMKLFLPLTAVFVVSSTLAYALNYAVVGPSTNSSYPADVIVASPVATSQELLDDVQLYALKSCLTAWSHVSAERPDMYAAGLEQFIESGCGAP
jgi:hypothetical protein